MINREYKRILSSSNCDYFEDLIETVFITNIKILSSVQINTNNSIGLNVNIPSSVHFIHKCYIESAKEIYKNPYIFENSRHLTPKEKHTNIRDSLSYIENSINSAIRDLLPIRDILKQGITKKSSIYESSISENESNIPNMKDRIKTEILDESNNNLKDNGIKEIKAVEEIKKDNNDDKDEDDDTDDNKDEDDNENDDEDEDDNEDDDEDDDEDEDDEDEESINMNKLQSGGNNINEKSEISNISINEDPEISISKDTIIINNNEKLNLSNENKEIIVNNDISQISDISETENIIVNESKKEPSHLFDKLSKAIGLSGGNSVKNYTLDVNKETIIQQQQEERKQEKNKEQGKEQGSIINNYSNQIKEIFIGKKNEIPLLFNNNSEKRNGLVNKQVLLKKKMPDIDRTNSLYKKKYDEYMRNSEIKSSSINKSEPVSVSVSAAVSAASRSESISKNIVLEDASEYISDNIDF
jgi:hypothetical protein